MNDENNKNETKKPVPLYEEGESLDALKAVPSLGIDPETGKEVFVKKDGSLTTIGITMIKWFVERQIPNSEAL